MGEVRLVVFGVGMNFKPFARREYSVFDRVWDDKLTMNFLLLVSVVSCLCFLIFAKCC